jgi:undecaprenyl-diphosphatase
MDTALFHLINHGMANPLFDVLMPALTHQGYLLGIPLALYTLYAGSRARTPEGKSFLLTALAAVLIALLAVPLADALVHQLKMLNARPRPCQALEGVRLLFICPSSFSMPSSHAATSFAFATPLFALTRPFLPLLWRITPLLIAAAIAFSRTYLGVHYFSDIVAGALLGSSVASLPCLLLRRARSPFGPSPE